MLFFESRDKPTNPQGDYASVQRGWIRKAQTSPEQEAMAGQKVNLNFYFPSMTSTHISQLVPRGPEDITSFDSTAEPPMPAHGQFATGIERGVGRSVDINPGEQAKREREVSHGHTEVKGKYG